MPNSSNEAALPPINVSAPKKKRNLPGRPDPDAEVIALSPRSLLTTNRFVCEICNKGFQRDQNLQLHRRGHNLPWRLKQKESHEYRKKVYICPEVNCVHHDPARALGDLTGIKKHFSRKHGEKKWKCEKCSKRYAVQSDWKAHQKTCGTKEYRCDCGTLFSRKDSFITHRAFCDVLENGKDLACNEESQRPAVSFDEAANEDVLEKETSVLMDMAGSPLSHISGDVLATSDFGKSILLQRVSDRTIPEEGIASLPSKWMQGGIGASNSGPSQGPGLSLSLGTGPGPGPPSGLQAVGSVNAPAPPFGYASPRDSNKLGFSQLASTESHPCGGRSSKHVPSLGAMGMLASLFSSPAHRQSSIDPSELVVHSVSTSDSEHGTLPAGLSSSAYDASFGSMKAYLPTASVATSATALLQKAAEMGAKASSPSMFQRYGGDPGFLRPSQGLPGESSWAGYSTRHVGSMLAPPNPNHVGGVPKSDEVWPSALQASGCGGMAGLRENMHLPGINLPNVPSSQPDTACNNSGRVSKLMMKGEKSSVYASLGDGAGCSQQGNDMYSRGQGEKQMVDFLGVGSDSAPTSGSSAVGVSQVLSPRDLGSITTLTAGIKVPKRLHYPGSRVG